MNLFYKISIDHVNANYISGWCCSRFAADRIVELQCCADGAVVASVRADRFREDLKSLGVHPSGRCGFEIVIPALQNHAHRTYSIREKRSGRELAEIDVAGNRVRYRNPLAGFNLRRPFFERSVSSPILFMHIPKTAGTSFNTLAQKLYGSEAVRTHIELMDKERYGDLLSSYRYISGHLRYHEIKIHFGSRDPDYYTIVREPYSQLHSHIKWLIQVASDDNDTFFRHNNPVIHRLGLDLADIETFSADTLRTLVDRLQALEAVFLDNEQTRYFLDGSPVRVSDHHIERALANRTAFKLIGATEHYDSFVEKFCMLNNLEKPDMGDRLNRSRTEDLFDYRDAEIREILEPLVYYDLMLYNAVIN